MRAFLVSVAIAVVISVAAALILESTGMSSADIFQSQGSVRL
jgi:hypothetical protein